MGNRNQSKFTRFWFPVILYSGIIFYVSSIPIVTLPMQGLHFDKLLHVFAYSIFGFLLARAVDSIGAPVERNLLLIFVVLGTFLYGFSDEVHQSFVPGRSTDILDITADVIGGVLGGLLYLLWYQRRHQ